jgi:tyrosine-protein phosphatase non-receptor type 14/21
VILCLQTQYFGLRYVTKKLQFHWIELDKPLKKQLDKHAQGSHSPRLYFGVMFYIPGAQKLPDEVARSVQYTTCIMQCNKITINMSIIN